MALAVTSAPFQNVAEPALDLRRQLGVGLQEGVVGATDMAVVQRAAGANFSVDIAAGEALVQGDTVTNQGRYYAYNDAVTNLTGFTAAHATLPRIDRVTLRVRDTFHDGSGSNDVAFVIVTGTATSGATLANLTGAAAVPVNQLLLANVLIPATATTITTANIDTTVRARAQAAISQSQVTFDAWQAFTPAWTSSGTAPALGNGSIAGRYIQIGKTVHAIMSMSIGSTSTFGTGVYFISLPVTASANEVGVFGTGQLFDTSAGAVYITGVLAQSTTLAALYSTAVPSVAITNTTPFTWATGDVLRYKITYEAA